MSVADAELSESLLTRVLGSFECLDGVSVSDLSTSDSGLINRTYIIGQRYVLQRLHPIFGAEVNDDIHAIGELARARGLELPHILPSRGGERWFECEGIWRVLSFLPGKTLHQLEKPSQAHSAGRLVGEFHRVMRDVAYTFKFSRGTFHDTSMRMTELKAALRAHPSHRLFRRVDALAREIFGMWNALEDRLSLPLRICHGDLKVSNLRFDESGLVATGLLDLDTMTHGTLDAELGDAFRSWCNKALEHAEEPHWDLDFFSDAWRGFEHAAGDILTAEERASIVPGTLRIILELSARFATDALNECYFGFDSTVASTRGEHNLLRAESQLALAMIVQKNRMVMDEIIHG